MRDIDVPEFWRALGLPGLADIHVHFLPERMLQKVWTYFDEVGGELGGGPWTITYRTDEPSRLATLRELGLRGIPSLTYAHKPGMSAWLNEWCTEFARRVPDAVHSATLFPEPRATEHLGAALDAGARLVKMHVQVGAYDPRDPHLDDAWDLLQDRAVPVVIHCGSGPAPGLHTGDEPIRQVLRRFPRLTLVIAHAGSPEYFEFADIATEFENVHLDTTMVATDFTESHAPMPEGYVARWRDLQHKVVLGSDFPNIPYPYAHQLEALERLDLGDEWMRDVLWHNGARLMGLADQ
ncbi:amidohydrolase family protein [Demetria terragena]|uniref:amidohydrolase family protein n=1 Tax=Demetria terragena TaxID=63959 RepID=UPI00036BB0BF|nr:amidohydrolase family protein [Demetria terragena]